MTDDRRLEIERRFDGEPDGSDSSPLVEDSEAQRHLDRLVLLRELARRHDPASAVPRKAMTLPDRRPRRTPGWLVLASMAAAIALICGWWSFRKGDVPGRLMVNKSTRPANRSVEALIGRPPLEVELYGWANTPSRTTGQAARLVLSPGPSSKKRSSADEILALELANTPLQPRSGVQRFAVSKGSKPPVSPKPVSRPRTTPPDV
jgi:hypothetical protein